VVKPNASAKANVNPANVWTISHFFFFNDKAESENLEEKPPLGVKQQRGEPCLWARRTD
jgi:hypothetical protein